MPKKSPRILVLDSWAVLAYLQDELPAADVIEDMLTQAANHHASLHMSLINAGEVFYCLARTQGVDHAARVFERLEFMFVRLHEAERADVLSAATWKANHRISYADGFALALAARLGGAVVTGDPEIHTLDHIIPVIRLTRHR